MDKSQRIKSILETFLAMYRIDGNKNLAEPSNFLEKNSHLTKQIIDSIIGVFNENTDMESILTVAVFDPLESFCFVNVPDDKVNRLVEMVRPKQSYTTFKIRFRSYFVSREIYTFSDIEMTKQTLSIKHLIRHVKESE